MFHGVVGGGDQLPSGVSYVRLICLFYKKITEIDSSLSQKLQIQKNRLEYVNSNVQSVKLRRYNNKLLIENFQYGAQCGST